jgi:hypothetical protein
MSSPPPRIALIPVIDVKRRAEPTGPPIQYVEVAVPPSASPICVGLLLVLLLLLMVAWLLQPRAWRR